jgi:hypothetical protein
MARAMRRAALRLSSALLFVALAAPALAADAWKLEKDADGIRIESRAVPGWSIREIRGTARIDAPLSAVVAVLDDVSAIPQLNDVVAEAKVVRRDSATHYQTYAAMKMPWPVSNRDIYNERAITQDAATHAVVIVDAAVADAPAQRGYVRIVKSKQTWTLTPLADGKVDAQMQVLSDPGGIPAALINAMSVSSPFNTLTQLRRLSALPKYAQATPAFLAP